MSTNEITVFNSDFTSGASGWSNNQTKNTYAGDRYLGGFGAGGYTEKTFDIPAGSESLTITFDFLEIDSWYKEHFYVYINGQEIDLGTFWHEKRKEVSWADQETSGSNGDISWSVSDTGAHIGNSIHGAGNRTWADEKHAVTITIQNPGDQLRLGFGSSLNEGADDESWGVDNLNIISRGNHTTPIEPPAEPVSTVVFDSDFASAVSGWSNNQVKYTKTGDAYLGGFGKGGYTEKTFDIPAGSERLQITFDFLEIDSWDGEHFYVHINGERIDLGKFRMEWRENSSTDHENSGIKGDISWTVSDTGAHIGNSIDGAGQSWWADEKHEVTITVHNPGDQLTLGFSSSLNGGVWDESWGVDNLKIISDIRTPEVIFNSDFASGASGWSNNQVNHTTAGDAYLGGFGRGGYTENTFDVSAGYETVEITFDFLEIDSWDNEHFYVHINDQRISLGRFRVEQRGEKSWADNENSGTSGNISWTVSDTGALIGNGKNGAGISWWADEKHEVKIIIQNPGDQLKLGFSSSLSHGSWDESWGVDNLKIVGHTAFNEASPAAYTGSDIQGALLALANDKALSSSDNGVIDVAKASHSATQDAVGVYASAESSPAFNVDIDLHDELVS